MPKTKDLKNLIVDACKAGDGYTKLSQCFQVSRPVMMSIFNKFKESYTVQNKPGRKRQEAIDFKDSGKTTSERCV